MYRFNIIKRLPKIPLLALAALALALMAGGGATAKPAEAATPYKIAVTFEYVNFAHIDDGYLAPLIADNGAELYGSLRASTSSNSGRLNLAGGKTGKVGANCTDKGVVWGDTDPTKAECFRRVYGFFGYQPNYEWKDTFLCASHDAYYCSDGVYKKNNDTIVLTVYPGQAITVAAALFDYDSWSSNDLLCNAAKNFGPFTDAQLATLNLGLGKAYLDQAYNGHASCKIDLTIKRIG